MSSNGQPPLSPWGERLRERTEPLAPDDAEHGYAHAHLAEALAKIFERVGPIYDPEEGEPGGPLVDVDQCPDWALGWLAQLVGVALPPGATIEQSRALIRDVAGWKRGSRDALRAAAGAFLTGNKTVYFRERDASSPDPPYTLEVVTRIGETPDPAAVEAALLRQKPGGIVLNYRTVEGWDYQELETSGPELYSAVDDSYTTYRLLREGPP